jgi:hypothetical protein
MFTKNFSRCSACFFQFVELTLHVKILKKINVIPASTVNAKLWFFYICTVTDTFCGQGWIFGWLVGFFGFFLFFFGFFGFFLGFLGFLGFFAQTRGFLGFFSVSRILLGASRL